MVCLRLVISESNAELMPRSRRAPMEKVPDWLDQLLFCEVERIRAQMDYEGRPDDPSPSTLYVLDCANADWDRLACHPPVVRAWLYDCEGQRTVISPDPHDGSSSLARILANEEHVRGRMFYDVGVLRFHIAPERDLVMVNYTCGPRYGAGWVARVIGEGSTAELVRDPAYSEWAA